MTGVDEQRPPTGRFAQYIGRETTPVSPIPREAQPYQGHRAGIVTRFIADAVDFVVVLVILLALYASTATLRFLANPTGFHLQQVNFLEALAAGALVLFVYLTAGWWVSGRTYGKHVMGLRLLNHDGARLHLVAAAARAAFCTLLPITLFWVVISPANRSVADVMLRTSVVHDWTVRWHAGSGDAPGDGGSVVA